MSEERSQQRLHDCQYSLAVQVRVSSRPRPRPRPIIITITICMYSKCVKHPRPRSCVLCII